MAILAKPLDFLGISPFVRYIHHQPEANSSNYYIPWRFIYDYELIFIVDGSMTVMTDDESYQLTAGDLHIMPPMIRHRRLIEEHQKCNYFSLHFDFIFMGEENDFSAKEAYIDNCNNKRIKNAPVDNKLMNRPLYTIGSIELPKKMKTGSNIAYVETLNRMYEHFIKKEFAYEIDLKCDMLTILKLILYDLKSSILKNMNQNEDSLTAIYQYVVENYSEPFCFEAICHMYGYSYSNFRKLFKQKTGKSPNTFLTDLRLNKAAELLGTGEHTVSEVADMVGYQDSCYFSRLFKSKKGIAPSNYYHKVKQ
jgi:AraC-like DNA-binding protein